MPFVTLFISTPHPVLQPNSDWNVSSNVGVGLSIGNRYILSLHEENADARRCS